MNASCTSSRFYRCVCPEGHEHTIDVDFPPRAAVEGVATNSGYHYLVPPSILRFEFAQCDVERLEIDVLPRGRLPRGEEVHILQWDTRSRRTTLLRTPCAA